MRLPAASAASAQSLNPLERLESLHPSQTRVGRVAVFFAPGDSACADELAGLADHAASFLARELGVDGPLRLAVLAPDDWYSMFPAIPHAIPWASMPHRLIFMPASLSEGLLIRGENELEDRRRVDFVLLHEVGHIVAKDYFRPTGSRDYLPVSWFEESTARNRAGAHRAQLGTDVRAPRCGTRNETGTRRHLWFCTMNRNSRHRVS